METIYIETENDKRNSDKDEIKTFVLTVKFRMSGALPDMVTKEHICSNVYDAIQGAVGEVELSGEYYGDIDDEWEIYLNGEIWIDAEEISVWVGSSPFCEYCGERHSDIGAEISNGGTSWCLDCYTSNPDHRLSDEDIKVIREKIKELKKDYYKKKIKEIDEDE